MSVRTAAPPCSPPCGAPPAPTPSRPPCGPSIRTPTTPGPAPAPASPPTPTPGSASRSPPAPPSSATKQSSALAGLRRACLADQLRALDTALALLERPGASLAARAADIAAGLADPGECGDTRELQRRGPEDPARAAELAELRADLARADALRNAGLHAEALANLDALAARLGPDAGPLRAAEQRSRGRLLAALGRDKDALASLQTAYFTSLAAGDDRLAAAAAIDLVNLSREPVADSLAGERWIRHARALLATTASPTLQAELARAEGQLAGTSAPVDAPSRP